MLSNLLLLRRGAFGGRVSRISVGIIFSFRNLNFHGDNQAEAFIYVTFLFLAILLLSLWGFLLET